MKIPKSQLKKLIRQILSENTSKQKSPGFNKVIEMLQNHEYYISTWQESNTNNTLPKKDRKVQLVLKLVQPKPPTELVEVTQTEAYQLIRYWQDYMKKNPGRR